MGAHTLPPSRNRISTSRGERTDAGDLLLAEAALILDHPRRIDAELVAQQRHVTGDVGEGGYSAGTSEPRARTGWWRRRRRSARWVGRGPWSIAPVLVVAAGEVVRTLTGASRTSSSTRPRPGEILVKLAASGLCHSDEHMVTGDMVLDPEIAEAFGLKQFPVIGGHEGAGVVVGGRPGVTAASRSATTSSSASSRRAASCPSCATGQPAPLRPRRRSCSPACSSPTSPYRHHAKDGRDLGIMCCSAPSRRTRSSSEQRA